MAADPPQRSPTWPPTSVRPLIVGVGVGGSPREALATVVRGIPRSAPLALLVAATDGEPIEVDGLRPAEHGAALEAGTRLLVPPGRELEIRDGCVWLADRDEPAPVDRLFRQITRATDGGCACVVLSGPGADGSIGLKRMKEDGGLTIVQDPNDALLDGMPRAAIATGLVDLVLGAAEIGPRLADLATRMTDASWPSDDPRRAGGDGTDTLRDILAYVRVRSGHDFSNYKRATLLRRVSRRMQVSQSDSLSGYLRHLRESPGELGSLLRDFMISVTNFFRDAESFRALEAHALPRIVARHEAGQPIRIWAAGCATGEEAYSLAILFAEHLAAHEDPPAVQIFATDIDQEALAEARAGLYPPTITSDVSEERLERFFVREPGGVGYRIKKELRERVLFSAHNILRDPPFSKLDLVTCRNLLIYLNREAQERVLGIFHFALRPDGYLMLGSSESAESAAHLFAASDAKNRIYGRRHSTTAVAFSEAFPVARWHAPALPTTATAGDRSVSFGELHHRLVEHYGPPSILVNDALEIVHVSEHVGQYLTLAGGEPTRSLVRLLPEWMRLDVRAAIYGAQQARDGTGERTIETTVEGERRVVTVVVRAVHLTDAAERMLLVFFEERAAEADGQPRRDAGDLGAVEPMVRQLEEELHRTRDHLRATVEQYETSVEELKASNEELHAINEELRSATEELETSKEELQSVNEELTTLNSELKDKIDEVSRARADLQNLMSSTEIGVVFLDRAMRIKRFTPRAQDVFNVIPGDVGRPLAHVTHGLGDVDLVADSQAVLDTLQTHEREVRTRSGAEYLVRVHPYRSMEDRIEGVVLTLLDVTRLKAAEAARRETEAALRRSEQRFRAALSVAPVVILQQDGGLRYTWGYGFGGELELSGRTDGEVFAAAEAGPFVALKRTVLTSGRGARAELRLTFPDRPAATWEVRVEPLLEEERVVGVTTTLVDGPSSSR